MKCGRTVNGRMCGASSSYYWWVEHGCGTATGVRTGPLGRCAEHYSANPALGNCAGCNERLTGGQVRPTMYAVARTAYLDVSVTPDWDQASKALQMMLASVTEKVPNLDIIVAEPWPGQVERRRAVVAQRAREMWPVLAFEAVCLILVIICYTTGWRL